MPLLPPRRKNLIKWRGPLAPVPTIPKERHLIGRSKRRTSYGGWQSVRSERDKGRKNARKCACKRRSGRLSARSGIVCAVERKIGAGKREKRKCGVGTECRHRPCLHPVIGIEKGTIVTGVAAVQSVETGTTTTAAGDLYRGHPRRLPVGDAHPRHLSLLPPVYVGRPHVHLLLPLVASGVALIRALRHHSRPTAVQGRSSRPLVALEAYLRLHRRTRPGRLHRPGPIVQVARPHVRPRAPRRENAGTLVPRHRENAPHGVGGEDQLRRDRRCLLAQTTRAAAEAGTECMHIYMLVWYCSTADVLPRRLRPCVDLLCKIVASKRVSGIRPCPLIACMRCDVCSVCSESVRCRQIRGQIAVIPHHV